MLLNVRNQLVTTWSLSPIAQLQLCSPSWNPHCLQARHAAGGNPALPSNLLDEMSLLVDKALRDAPASCSDLATSSAALASASKITDSTCSADCQPSADHRAAGTVVISHQALQEASVKLQESDEQALKHADPLGSSASVRSIGSKKVNKPAWAMTADAAHDAEQQDEEDLLAFAGGLEFDKYINQQEDAELRNVLQVKPDGWSVRTACHQKRTVCVWPSTMQNGQHTALTYVYRLLTTQASWHDCWFLLALCNELMMFHYICTLVNV